MAMNETMIRINRIFESVLGCSLEFQAADELTTEQWAAGDLEDLKTPRAMLPHYVEGLASGSFGFPINHAGQFAGLAVVHGMQEARPKKLMLLAELLTMVLEFGLKQEDRRERLRIIEERLTLMEGVNSNVIPLRPARFERVMQVTEMPFISDIASPEKPLVTMPLLIQAQAHFPLNRVALEIHQISKRWAFLSSDDLPQDIFSSRESLQELGGLTLFIPNLAKLSTTQQLKLAEYLATKPGLESPHVIAGVDEEIATLEAEGRLVPHLASLFTLSKLEFASKTPQEITGALIDASLQHIFEGLREESHAIGEHIVPFHIQYFGTEDTSTFH